MCEIYQELGGISRAELLAKCQKMVKPSRFQHMLGVEKAAGELAERYGENVEIARLAGLLHDYAKELSQNEFFRLIEQYGLDQELKNWGSNIWHGMVGWLKIREDFPEISSEILKAIEYHTVGSAEMSQLDKIVYVADYIEENRDFPGADEARLVAAQSLDAAVAFETARTIEFLASNRLPIFPQTILTYNAFIGALKELK